MAGKQTTFIVAEFGPPALNAFLSRKRERPVGGIERGYL
jgi:hypothetical protein